MTEAPPTQWGPEADFRLPEDVEAERSLLATLCGAVVNGTRQEVLADLDAEDFAHPSHRRLLAALRGLVEVDEEVNLITLKDALARAGNLEKIGGTNGLSELLCADEVGSPKALVRILKRKRRFRELIRIGTQILQAGSTEDGDPETVLATAVEKMGATGHSSLTVHSAADFLDHPVPEPRWVVPGLIPEGVPQVLASKGGLGKSWLALQLCVCLACGKSFMGYEAAAPKGAVYFGLEDGKDVVHKRIHSIVETYRFTQDWTPADDENLRRNMAVLAVNWDADSATTYLPDLMPAINAFLARSKALPGLMVLDTLARFAGGDENTVEALRPILAACNRICHAGWTSLMLHHVAKGQDGARTKDKPSLADRMSTEWVRGSSAIVDNFRGVIQLVGLREDEADRAGLDVDKARQGDYLVIGATKTNGGAKSDWKLLEQGDSGVWFLPEDAQESLARIRGAKAVEALNKQMEFLIELFHATRYGQEPDKTNICNKLSPTSKDPMGWFRQNVRRLRNSGFVQKNSYLLTASGLQHVTGVTRDRTTDD